MHVRYLNQLGIFFCTPKAKCAKMAKVGSMGIFGQQTVPGNPHDVCTAKKKLSGSWSP